MEFLNLPLRTGTSKLYKTIVISKWNGIYYKFSVEKKTFIVKNETSIPTNFRLRLKNFYPVMCSCEGISLEDRIKSIYKRIHCRQKDLIGRILVFFQLKLTLPKTFYSTEETMYRVKQPNSGVVIYIDPLCSNIGPFEAVPVDIYAYGDTWGIYVDKLEINITGLPLYTLDICVQVVGSPISVSISDRDQLKVPVLKYVRKSTYCFYLIH